MNWDIIEGKWSQLTGQVQEKWGKLTNDEVDQIEGNREQLVGRIQERYGMAKDDVEREVNEWARTIQ